MNQTLREFRALRRGNAHLRIRKSSRRPIRAAHPLIAGTLVRVASKSADTLERFVDSGWFSAVFFAIGAGIFYLRVEGLL